LSSSHRQNGYHTHPPHAVDHTSTDPSPSGRKILFFSALGVLIVAIVLALRSVTTTAEKHTVVRFGRAQAIQLDVLNGTKEAKLAQRVTDYLRSRGFDVVEMGNYKVSSVETTLVLDRTGNIEAAREVAEALGVPETNIRTSIDKDLFLDVSIILGNDFKQLRSR
jgi:uncharacterized membrane protein